jgi:spermidine synthase
MFKELDYRETPLGALSLRQRYDPKLNDTVLEIKLGDEFLMSSAFTVSEVALAQLALAELQAPALDVVIGGLGLGYTAAAALADDKVAELIVMDALAAVIDWHREGILPLGETLTGDSRCRLVEGDFFAHAASAEGFDPDRQGRRFDAILVDIDHSPDALLANENGSFYAEAGLAGVARHLKPGGVFALWSNEDEDAAFTARLAEVFTTARGESVTFHNPLQDRPFTQTIYLARTADTDAA